MTWVQTFASLLAICLLSVHRIHSVSFELLVTVMYLSTGPYTCQQITPSHVYTHIHVTRLYIGSVRQERLHEQVKIATR